MTKLGILAGERGRTSELGSYMDGEIRLEAGDEGVIRMEELVEIEEDEPAE